MPHFREKKWYYAWLYKGILYYMKVFRKKMQFHQEFQPCFLPSISQVDTALWKTIYHGGDKDILLPAVQKKVGPSPLIV
ncbi:hypothetical protein REPUB_Repub12eG0115300 [Reevesia pubescens]